MENFENMLKDYMDIEMINDKLALEEPIEIPKRVENKKSKNDFVRTISMCDFVRYYLGTNHECKNLMHKGLKSFDNPYIIGISNDFALKNPDCIIRNEIVVVLDSYGNPGTYINPSILRNIKTMEEYKHVVFLFEKIKVHNIRVARKNRERLKILYNKIESLQQTYDSTCELLSILEKKYIIKEIRKYVKSLKQHLDYNGICEKKEFELNEVEKLILNNVCNEEKFNSKKQLRRRNYNDKY